jgi:hypothetical protein
VTRDGTDARMFDANPTLQTSAPLPNDAKMTGIISGSSFRWKTLPNWRTSVPSRAS